MTVGVVMSLIATSQTSVAQEIPYKYSAGVSLGMSGYAGDASSSIFSHPGFVGEGVFRYQYDARWSFGGNLAFLAVSGNSADMDGVRPGGIE